MLPDSLRNAYLAAIYRFDAAPSCIELRVELPCPALQEWMQSGGHEAVAIITAFNPGSRRCDGAMNAAAQAQLRDFVVQLGLPCIAGQNLDPADAWPPEDSLLIARLSLEAARALALRFGQLAFLWCDAAAVPQLHTTSGP